MSVSESKMSFKTEFYKDGNDFFVVETNGAKFALIDKKTADDSIHGVRYKLRGYNVIVLSDIKSTQPIHIEADIVIVLNNLFAQCVTISAEEMCVLLREKWVNLTEGVIVSKIVHLAEIEEYRREIISNLFKNAIISKSTRDFLNALAQTFDAVQDPLGRETSNQVDLASTLAFFNIPNNPQS